jgi:hypothetical protein
MKPRQWSLAKLVAHLALCGYTLVFCLAGIAFAFALSVRLFGLTREQLYQEPASYAFLGSFVALEVVLVSCFALLGYGLLVFLCYRLSATKFLVLIGPQHQGFGPIAPIVRWVHQRAARLGGAEP